MPTATPVARSSRRDAGARRARTSIAIIAGAVIVVASLLATTSLLTGPERMDVVVQNPTAYDVNVRVEPAQGGTGLGLGAVPAGTTRTFSGVVDQGDLWRFEFRYAGIVAGDMTVAADDVAAAAVVVPSSAERVLREADVLTPP